MGAFAAVKDDRLRLVAVVATADGAKLVRSAAEGTDPAGVVSMLAQRLRAEGAESILAELHG
jgi:porphobilinogen deaminase